MKILDMDIGLQNLARPCALLALSASMLVPHTSRLSAAEQPISQTQADLSSMAETSLDFFRELQLDMLRSQAISNSCRKRMGELQLLHARGHASPQSVRWMEKYQRQSDANAAHLNQACNFLENNIEGVWRRWHQLWPTTSQESIIEVPGVSFNVGGHMLFGMEAHISPAVLQHSREYLQAQLDQSTELRQAQSQLREARQFAEKLKSLQYPRKTDIGHLNSKVFEAAYQIEQNRIDYYRLRRDLSRIDNVLKHHETGSQPQMPWLSSTIAGLGGGWRQPLPLDPYFIGETLPLALAKAQSTSALQVARIKTALAKDRVDAMKELKRRGSASDVSVRQAERDLSIAYQEYHIAHQELDIARSELVMLQEFCGISNADLEEMAKHANQLVWDISIPSFVLDCRSDPAAFCGATRTYVELVQAQADMEVTAIECQYRRDIQQRLSGKKYLREAELREATFLVEATKAAHQQAKELEWQKRLELRQWSVVHRKLAEARRDNSSNFVYGIYTPTTQVSQMIADKRANLAHLQCQKYGMIHSHQRHVYSKIVELLPTGGTFAYEAQRSGLQYDYTQGMLNSKAQEQRQAQDTTLLVGMIRRDNTGYSGILQNLGELKPHTKSKMLDLLAVREMPHLGTLHALQARVRQATARATEEHRLLAHGHTSPAAVARADHRTEVATINLQGALQQRAVGTAAANMLDEVDRANPHTPRKLMIEPIMVKLE